MSESSGEEFFEALDIVQLPQNPNFMQKSSTFPRRNLELDISPTAFQSPEVFHTPSNVRLNLEVSPSNFHCKPSPTRSSVSPDASTPAGSGFDRRSKLEGLRSRLRQELEDSELDGSIRQSSSLAMLKSESTASVYGLTVESDKMSLASWSKDLLQRKLVDSPSGQRKASIMSEEDFVLPADTISTKGDYVDYHFSSVQPSPPPADPAPLFVLPPPPNSGLLSSATPFAAGNSRLVTSSSLEEAKSSSSGSKSSTLDRQASFGSGGLLLGTSAPAGNRVGCAPNDSLASIVSDFGSGRSSKSNSLNRDAGSGYDESAMALLERRNSEAAEIIDALACEVVPEAVAASLSNERLPDLPEEPECPPIFPSGVCSLSDPIGFTRFESPSSSQSQTPTQKMSPVVSASSYGNSSLRLSSSSSLRSALDTTPSASTASGWTTPASSSSSCGRIGPPASVVHSGFGAKQSTHSMHHSSLLGTPSVLKQPDVVASCSAAPDCPVPPPRRKKMTSSIGSDSDRLTGSGNVTPIMRDVESPDGRPLSMPTFDSPKLARTDSHSRRLPPVLQSPLNASNDSILQADPLSLHMMRLTAHMDQNLDQTSVESDAGSVSSSEFSTKPGSRDYLNNARNITTKYGKLLGRTVGLTFRKTASKIKKVSDHYRSDKDDRALGSDEEEIGSDAGKVIQVRASHHNKGPYDFDQIRLAQDLSGEHTGAIWCVKFSLCGRLMATAGQDNLIRIWVLKDAFDYFNDMRIKYNAETADAGNSSGINLSSTTMGGQGHSFRESSTDPSWSPASSRGDGESGASSRSGGPLAASAASIARGESFASFASSEMGSAVGGPATLDEMWWPFRPQAFCFYRGHTADVLDVAWSKNYFLLSSSMDRTVRLWHISRDECLCCFQHIDFVTAIAFLPRDDRYFLSGCLDGKLRLWNIPEKKVALWNEIDNGTLITAMTFVKSGKYAVVGTFDGRCIFYSTDHLKYFTQLDIKSTRRKNAKARKIMGLEATADKLLVTSNDSRIRLFDLTDLSLTCKYKGCSNGSSQIKASFSPNGKHIVCGSEDKGIFLWRTFLDALPLSVRKDRNRLWEAIKVHNAVVTAAVFAPKPELIFQQIDDARRRSGEEVTSMAIPVDMMNDSLSRISISSQMSSFRRPSNARHAKPSIGDVLVSADFTGSLLIFINKPKVRTGSSIFLPSY